MIKLEYSYSWYIKDYVNRLLRIICFIGLVGKDMAFFMSQHRLGKIASLCQRSYRLYYDLTILHSSLD